MRAAAEVVGGEVRDAVPLVRRRPGGGRWIAGGVAVFAVLVFLHGLGMVPGPRALVYLPGAFAMSLMFQMANDLVFVVLTPAGLVVTGSTRWVPRPVPPVLGPLDPRVVSGPDGLLRNSYDVGGTRHQVGWQHRARLEQMLAAARSGLPAH